MPAWTISFDTHKVVEIQNETSAKMDWPFYDDGIGCIFRNKQMISNKTIADTTLF